MEAAFIIALVSILILGAEAVRQGWPNGLLAAGIAVFSGSWAAYLYEAFIKA